jgi:hypothetical protein
MACKRGVLALEELVDAEQRRIRIGVDEKRRCDVLREDRRRRWVYESSVIYEGRCE